MDTIFFPGGSFKHFTDDILASLTVYKAKLGNADKLDWMLESIGLHSYISIFDRSEHLPGEIIFYQSYR